MLKNSSACKKIKEVIQLLMAKLRFATTDDTKQILAIYEHYVKNTAITFEYEVPNEVDFLMRIKTISESYPYIVATLNKKIIGYAYATKFRERKAYDWAVETSVYIDKDHRDKGIGKKLYTKLLDLLTEQGFVMAYACVTCPNFTSDALHSSLGFSKIGVFSNSGYKFEAWHDIVWYEKQLHSTKKESFEIKPIKKLKKTSVAEGL